MRPRDLLSDGPDGYVAARTAAAKAARAAGDRDLAAELKALGKPTAALWAVLAAADDEQLVRDTVTATSELAGVQAAGDRAAIVAATRRRKELVERVIAAAVADAGRWGDVAGGRRDEIRRIVERLTRSPESVGAWVDATLRTLPDDAGGFSVFDGMTVASPPASAARPARSRARQGQHTVEASDDVLTVPSDGPVPGPDPAPEPEPVRPDPMRVRRADRRLAEAERRLVAAAERLERAEAALTAATADADRARAAAAEAARELATRRTERSALDE
jgi:hypothetical protein